MAPVARRNACVAWWQEKLHIAKSIHAEDGGSVDAWIVSVLMDIERDTPHPRCIRTPDATNIEKSVEDALTAAGAWGDDRQVQPWGCPRIIGINGAWKGVSEELVLAGRPRTIVEIVEV